MFQKYVNISAQIKGTWRYDLKWNCQKLSYIYNSVKDMFDLNEVSNMGINYKQFEQQIWDLIYYKLNKNKHLLVGEEQ